MSAKTILFGIKKGGAGKTTIATNQAALFSQKGKTLLVDLDPQGNSALYYGFDPNSSKNIIDLLKQPGNKAKCIDKFVLNLKDKGLGNLDILAANSDLNTELVLKQADTYKSIFQALTEIANSDLYDYVLIDTNPGWNPLIANLIIGVDMFIIPFLAEAGCDFAMKTLIGSMPEILKKNEDLSILIVPNRFSYKKRKGVVIETVDKQLLDRTIKNTKKFKQIKVSSPLKTSTQYQNAFNGFLMPLTAIWILRQKLTDEEFKKQFEYSKNDSVIKAFGSIYKNQKEVFDEILKELE